MPSKPKRNKLKLQCLNIWCCKVRCWSCKIRDWSFINIFLSSSCRVVLSPSVFAIMSPQDKILKCSKCKIRANQLNVEGKSAFYIVCPTCGVKRDAVWFESFNRKYAENLFESHLILFNIKQIIAR